MAKGQQKSNKESKKPKKDTSDAKPIAVDAMRPKPITTAIIPKGKKPIQWAYQSTDAPESLTTLAHLRVSALM